ncbi:polar amino acid ABC transporter permease [Saccharopolyspora subtropica]|uniref:Amino acid ABC transporter permease n=1 Tax=Saccharopolyspora thermophila TaxID=89367 RepID=A0A917JVQ9_9PSEU|nr:amino acid ABC transporter permease [Saccharopolyspora subtropica]GGI86047.1 polar amino acid ABC transporter permease [Saccharopolyspora subtropica]
MTTVDTVVGAADELVIVRRRRPWRIVGTAVLVVLAAALLHSLVTNEQYEWDVVAEYLTARSIAQGALLTVELTAITMVAGLLLGIVLAVMRLSPSRLISGAAAAYIWFFRGTPLLIQLIFWFNLSALYPVLELRIPFGPVLVAGNANDLITPFVAAVLGLALNEAAYMAEIVRGGLFGVDRGQTEAAQALGMGRWHILRRIVLPQAMRIIIPPTANQTVATLKNTSLVSVLGAMDLMHSAQVIYSRTYQTMPLLIVAAVWYLAMTSVLTVVQHRVERHFGKGAAA